MGQALASAAQGGALYIESVDARNIHHLERMIEQQAEHHNCKFIATTKQIFDEVCAPNPLSHAFLIHSPDETKPLGYAFYSLPWTLDGRTLYLEDICADKTVRGGRGVGTFGFQALNDIALNEGCKAINWVVMRNNDKTLGFYNKIGAHFTPKSNYDLSDIFTHKSRIGSRGAYTIEKVDDSNIVLPMHFNNVNDDPYSSLLMVKDADGDPAALVMTNECFSTFRGVRGTQVEPVRFFQNFPLREAKKVLASAFHAVCDDAEARGAAGHMYAYAKHKCTASDKFLQKVAPAKLQMNDDSDSVLVSMSLKLKPAP
jgi:hypothetical protein